MLCLSAVNQQRPHSMPLVLIDLAFFPSRGLFLLRSSKTDFSDSVVAVAVGPVPSRSISCGRAVHGLGNIFEEQSSAPSIFVSARICSALSVLDC
jgi:hypothetical protein